MTLYAKPLGILVVYYMIGVMQDFYYPQYGVSYASGIFWSEKAREQ